MFGALAHGLPSLALPESADNFTNATLLAEAGAAQVLMPRELTGAAVRSSLRTVLGAVTYRQRAPRLADETAAMPSPADVAASQRAQHARPFGPSSTLSDLWDGYEGARRRRIMSPGDASAWKWAIR
jgi:UDP:flavonoid glycosyltransferase YjiC (YdhE family)